jgi:hypothetical protein
MNELVILLEEAVRICYYLRERRWSSPEPPVPLIPPDLGAALITPTKQFVGFCAVTYRNYASIPSNCGS